MAALVNYSRISLQKSYFDKYRKIESDDISYEESEAFRDGLNSQISWGEEFSSVFNFNDYVNYKAFCAGKQAVEQVEVDICLKFKRCPPG